MENNNGLPAAESWYAPLKKTESVPEKAAERPKEHKTAWRIAGIAFIVLLLIVGTSVAFGNGSAAEQGSAYGSGNMPGSAEEFFDSYYGETESSEVEYNVPTTKYDGSFELEFAPADSAELSLSELYEKCYKSIVAIYGYVDDMDGYYWGTGVIMSEDGLILTNTHILDGCDRMEVILYDDSSFEAQVVGADGISDLTVLKINATGLQTAQFGDSALLKVGDSVAAIGNPIGEEFRMTMTDGIISAIERGINYNGHSMTLLQTNTALNHGNSGGALFNMRGQVIGITNMRWQSSYSTVEGIAFAIPSATAQTVANALVRDGEVRGRPAIGLTLGAIPESAAEEYELPEGLYVTAVSENSDAAAKGIKKGDIVTAVNSVAVKTTDEVVEIRNGLAVGDSMTFTVWRDGESFDVEIVLGDQNDLT